MINPQTNLGHSCFNDATVDQKVHATLKELGVEVIRGHKILRWGEGPDGSISGLALKVRYHKLYSLRKNMQDESLSKITNIGLLLYADEKSVNPDSFKAINDSCLVFDGRLVIDKYFRTQDPFM